MDEADLNRNPYAIDFINTDLTLAPVNFKENVITPAKTSVLPADRARLGLPFQGVF